jgi:hypothetical protein
MFYSLYKQFEARRNAYRIFLADIEHRFSLDDVYIDVKHRCYVAFVSAGASDEKNNWTFLLDQSVWF